MPALFGVFAKTAAAAAAEASTPASAGADSAPTAVPSPPTSSGNAPAAKTLAAAALDHLQYCLGYCKRAAKAAKPHEQLDVLLKFGETLGNVMRAGSGDVHATCVEGAWLTFIVMDLMGTGAMHDVEIPIELSDNLTVVARLSWEHCHGLEVC